jgi:hypothetical protein
MKAEGTVGEVGGRNERREGAREVDGIEYD